MKFERARKAVVLAAGFGTRLRPFTASTPKPLLPVWDEPMLSRVVDLLRSWGVEEIAVNCHHLHGQVEAWCEKNGCQAVHEPEILGTGGVLNQLRDWIGGDDFYLANGDIVVENAPEEGLGGETAPASGAQTLGWCLVSEDGPRTIEAEPEHGFVTCWHSPDPGWPGTFTYCGIARLRAKVLDYVVPQGFSSIVDAYEKAAMDGWLMRSVRCDGMLWTDAGTVETYMELNRDGKEHAYAKIPQVSAALAALGGGKHGSGGGVEFAGARGSDRAFFKTDGAYIIVYDDAKRGENARYASHARFLAAHGIRVPKVLADLPQAKTLVLEDAGGDDLLSRSRVRGEDRLYDYVAAVEELARFNALLAAAKAEGVALEPKFDTALYKWERDLFAEHCLGTRFRRGLPADVEKELEQAAARLLEEPPALVHRDFQSTNIVWNTKDFKIIDFQGMREGAAAYDLASLLYDPYIELRDGERRALAALYAKKSGHSGIADVLPFAAVQRLVQALGAYGRLASVGKKEFSRHVLPALQNLLTAADEAGFDATGALAEDLIAEEQKSLRRAGGEHGHDHGHDCGCGEHGCEGHGHHHCDCGGEK